MMCLNATIKETTVFLDESHLWRKELREVGMDLKRTFPKTQQAEGST